jgi:protein TonB
MPQFSQPHRAAHATASPRRRVRRVFIWSLLASVAVHVLALRGFPVWMTDRPLTPPRVLDVVLVQAQPDLESARPVLSAPPPVTPPAPKPRPAAPASTPRTQERPAVLPQPLSPAVPQVAAPDSSAGTSPAPAPRAEAAAAAPSEGRSLPAETTATLPSANASYLRNPPPRYPLIARRNGEQGTVMLKVLVTREGLPSLVSVEKTSGSSHLDQAALDTVKTWRFAPARRGEQSVEAWVLVPVVFRLEGVS